MYLMSVSCLWISSLNQIKFIGVCTYTISIFPEFFRFIAFIVVEIYDKRSRFSNTRPCSNTGHVIVLYLADLCLLYALGCRARIWAASTCLVVIGVTVNANSHTSNNVIWRGCVTGSRRKRISYSLPVCSSKLPSLFLLCL